MKATDYRKSLHQYQGQAKQLEQTIAQQKTNLATYKLKEIAIDEVDALIQLTAQETQNTLRYHIEDLVQSALDSCFPDMYDFLVDFVIKRGKTEADMYLLDNLNGKQKVKPTESNGGGLVDLVAFSLRLVSWSLSQTAPIILLDEPFKWLSVDLRPLAGEMMRALSEKLGLQIIMVTHDEAMIDISDRVFKVTKRKGVSNVVQT